MTIGTRSVLFGAHQFMIHPFVLAWAWWKLYGFPWDPRLWVAFFVHDLGYLGKPNMDGVEGESHPILGAQIMARLFGMKWGEFTLLHSRYFANRVGKPVSKLCVADKLAIVITPSWLYIPMVSMTGELTEYMGLTPDSKYLERDYSKTCPKTWLRQVKDDMRRWVNTHKDLSGLDSWKNPNGIDVKEAPMAKLPGYLDGGYEPSRYIILKADGTPVNPKAKYMVFRYDKDRDPHAIFACLAYAISVEQDNADLCKGILDALRIELGLTWNEFHEEYDYTINNLKHATNDFRGSSPKQPQN